MLKVDNQIILQFSEHYQRLLSYPPFVSKVCAYMLFDFTRKGVTFEELLSYFDVSKSTISVAINYLLNVNHIRVLEDVESRKRHFVLTEHYMVNKYKEIFEGLDKEKELLENIKQFKDHHGVVNKKLDYSINTMIEIIEGASGVLKQAIIKLKSINNYKISAHEDEL